MTEIGEVVTPPEFISPQKHDKSICPWHQKKQGKSTKAEPQKFDEDTFDEIPENLGDKLGDNLNKRGPAQEKEPLANDGSYVEVMVAYRAKGRRVAYRDKGKKKTVQPYAAATDDDDVEEWAYPVQYAPHHLIPGNESLKNNPVIAYMGDSGAIADYNDDEEAPVDSEIEQGYIGYDVNAAENGVWLPSPYAISNNNEWPAEAGIEAIREGSARDSAQRAKETEEFKLAFTVAAIKKSGGRQFHMRHAGYSKRVRAMLEEIAAKLWLLSTQDCPLERETKNKKGKCDPPYGLVGRLNVLSGNLRRLTKGSLWRPPLYTDKLTEQYAGRFTPGKKKGRMKKVI
jgi:hypothetical protein